MEQLNTILPKHKFLYVFLVILSVLSIIVSFRTISISVTTITSTSLIIFCTLVRQEIIRRNRIICGREIDLVDFSNFLLRQTGHALVVVLLVQVFMSVIMLAQFFLAIGGIFLGNSSLLLPLSGGLSFFSLFTLLFGVILYVFSQKKIILVQTVPREYPKQPQPQSVWLSYVFAVLFSIATSFVFGYALITSQGVSQSKIPSVDIDNYKFTANSESLIEIVGEKVSIVKIPNTGIEYRLPTSKLITGDLLTQADTTDKGSYSVTRFPNGDELITTTGEVYPFPGEAFYTKILSYDDIPHTEYCAINRVRLNGCGTKDLKDGGMYYFEDISIEGGPKVSFVARYSAQNNSQFTVLRKGPDLRQNLGELLTTKVDDFDDTARDIIHTVSITDVSTIDPPVFKKHVLTYPPIELYLPDFWGDPVVSGDIEKNSFQILLPNYISINIGDGEVFDGVCARSKTCKEYTIETGSGNVSYAVHYDVFPRLDRTAYKLSQPIEGVGYIDFNVGAISELYSNRYRLSYPDAHKLLLQHTLQALLLTQKTDVATIEKEGGIQIPISFTNSPRLEFFPPNGFEPKLVLRPIHSLAKQPLAAFATKNYTFEDCGIESHQNCDYNRSVKTGAIIETFKPLRTNYRDIQSFINGYCSNKEKKCELMDTGIGTFTNVVLVQNFDRKIYEVDLYQNSVVYIYKFSFSLDYETDTIEQIIDKFISSVVVKG